MPFTVAWRGWRGVASAAASKVHPSIRLFVSLSVISQGVVALSIKNKNHIFNPFLSYSDR
jgi:hypothetical protein